VHGGLDTSELFESGSLITETASDEAVESMMLTTIFGTPGQVVSAQLKVDPGEEILIVRVLVG
jgi:hypothetical protein